MFVEVEEEREKLKLALEESDLDDCSDMREFDLCRVRTSCECFLV